MHYYGGSFHFSESSHDQVDIFFLHVYYKYDHYVFSSLGWHYKKTSYFQESEKDVSHFCHLHGGL